MATRTDRLTPRCRKRWRRKESHWKTWIRRCLPSELLVDACACRAAQHRAAQPSHGTAFAKLYRPFSQHGRSPDPTTILPRKGVAFHTRVHRRLLAPCVNLHARLSLVAPLLFPGGWRRCVAALASQAAVSGREAIPPAMSRAAWLDAQPYAKQLPAMKRQRDRAGGMFTRPPCEGRSAPPTLRPTFPRRRMSCCCCCCCWTSPTAQQRTAARVSARTVATGTYLGQLACRGSPHGALEGVLVWYGGYPPVVRPELGSRSSRPRPQYPVGVSAQPTGIGQ